MATNVTTPAGSFTPTPYSPAPQPALAGDRTVACPSAGARPGRRVPRRAAVFAQLSAVCVQSGPRPGRRAYLRKQAARARPPAASISRGPGTARALIRPSLIRTGGSRRDRHSLPPAPPPGALQIRRNDGVAVRGPRPGVGGAFPAPLRCCRSCSGGPSPCLPQGQSAATGPEGPGTPVCPASPPRPRGRLHSQGPTS